MQKQQLLNDYQSLMRSFSQDAPYNAVHFFQVKPLDKAHLEEVINIVISDIGLGHPKFYKRCVSYREIKKIIVLEVSSDIETHAYHEMSYMFADNEFPLRFFIVRAKGHCFISVTYNHWVADAYAIYRLIVDILRAYNSSKQTVLSLPYNQKNAVSYHHLKRFFIKSYLALSSGLSFSKAIRPEMLTYDTLDKSLVSWSLLESSVIESLKSLAKENQVTINDVFLTLVYLSLMETEAYRYKQKWYKPKRNKIILSVVCNIRHLSVLNKDLFGLFLGFFSIGLSVDETKDFSHLISIVHAQTKRAKQRRLPLLNTLLFSIQRRFYQKSKSPFKTFRKNTPVTAGISNMNLDTANDESHGGPYTRFSPAGPMCPLVFNFTTLNNQLTFTMTASSNRYTQQSLDKLKQSFLQQMYAALEVQRAA